MITSTIIKVDMGRWGLPSLDAEGKGNGKKKKPPLMRTRLFTHSRLIQCLTQWGLFSRAVLYHSPTKRDL